MSLTSFDPLTLDQRLSRCHVKLMNSSEFIALGGVMMTGDRKIVGGGHPNTAPCPVPTAMTDGYHVWYGHDFCMKLPEKQLAFIVVHENFHKVYRHMQTWKHLWERDARTANIACDHVVNNAILEADPDGRLVEMPEGGVCDPKYRGWDAGAVFRDLQQQKNQQQQQQQQDPTGGDGEEGDEGLDTHHWEGDEGCTEEEKETRGREIENAIRRGQEAAAEKQAGRGAGGMSREMQAALLPPVDWRQVMTDFVTEVTSGGDISTWARPSRRSVASGIYMPSTYSENVGEMLVAIDASASVSGSLLGAFINHVSIMAQSVNPAAVHLTFWDEVVEAYQRFVPGQYADLHTLARPVGGGGTTPTAVTRWLSRNTNVRPVCALVLTDGYVNDWGGQWPCPVLWVIAGNLSARPTIGRAVQVTREG